MLELDRTIPEVIKAQVADIMEGCTQLMLDLTNLGSLLFQEGHQGLAVDLLGDRDEIESKLMLLATTLPRIQKLYW